MKGVTSAQAFQRQPGTPQRPVLQNRFLGVLGARGEKRQAGGSQGEKSFW